MNLCKLPTFHGRNNFSFFFIPTRALSLDYRLASFCLPVLHTWLISSTKFLVSGGQVTLSHSNNAFQNRTWINVRLNQPSFYLKMSAVWLTHLLPASEWQFLSIQLFFQHYQWDFTLSSCFIQSFITADRSIMCGEVHRSGLLLAFLGRCYLYLYLWNNGRVWPLCHYQLCHLGLVTRILWASLTGR